MSGPERVRMVQVIDGVRRVIRVLPSAVGQHSASGWQIDDSPDQPPSPKPRKPRPAPTPTGAGTPSTTIEQE